ncbi:MAG: endolytic transglycosylase MltG [Bacteroidaceae bacterium]
MEKANKKRIFILVGAIVAVVLFCIWYSLFSSAFAIKETTYIYVDKNDNIDSVYAKIDKAANPSVFIAFKAIGSLLSYDKRVHTGCYAIEPGDGNLAVVRRLRNRQQAPIHLTIQSVRTMDKLASSLSNKLMMDSVEVLRALTNNDICQTLGYDTTTIACLFIPNTYDIYWDISVEHFLERMKKESAHFWTAAKTSKAKAAGLTQKEVITLASIVDEETSNNGEKAKIAGMYLNRLKLGMPLQADPTIKFALKQFALKRIYNNLLQVKSPYNTYKNIGLPPGPIRIPSVAGIESVLDFVHHPYLYMCAKEDFSGTHNFAVTYAEHLANAAKYTKALNERGIK